ncbi:VG15 protein [Glutamicibacter sp. TV12E]|uniref:VG15 protein n=1 Tax=Glutamicibacter sp. TV12E TaxID=3446362 RepID=UPI0040343CDC
MAALATVSPTELHDFQRMLVSEAIRDLGELWSLVPDPTNGADVKAVLAEYYPTLVETYGAPIAVMAAEKFEESRRIANANGTFMALLAPPPDKQRVQSHVWSMLEPIFRGADSDPEEALRNLEGLTSRLVLEQSRRTVNDNVFAKGSGADGFVRVPSRIDTCEFCLMLATKTYRSNETAGKGRNFHNRCNCSIMPHFEAIVIEGYDQEGYLRQYNKKRYGTEASE